MGKRELVLIAVFVVMGICVYQFTAPPPPPGSDVSVGGIFQKLRRGVRGTRETASQTSTQSFAVAAGVRQLRIILPRPCDLTITATDRHDVTARMQTRARGYDQTEAKAAAASVQLKADTTSASMLITGVWSDRRGQDAGRVAMSGQGAVDQIVIAMEVPAGVALRLEPHIGLLNVTGAASFEGISSRGETHVLKTAGAVQVSHIGGQLEVDGGASLKLTSRNSRGTLAHIGGLTSIDATGSKLRLTDIGGPLEIESRNSDVALERTALLKPPLRYNGTGGELRVEGLRTEARIDGRNTDIDVVMDAPAPVTIYNLGAIRVTAPAGGYTLDAAATEGRIESEDSSITATPEGGADARAAAKIRGGGPPLTLRATRGRIEVRKAAGK